MTDTDRMSLLGTLPDLDFNSDGSTCYVDREAHRDYDTILIPSARLDARGRATLRALLDKADHDIAAYRLRTADLSGIDMDEARESLEFFGFYGTGLAAVDWAAVGRRLEAMARYGGDVELRKLHTLLTADETPAAEAAS